MTRRLPALYPFLFAVLPVLYLAERNPGQVTLADLILILAVILAAFFLVHLGAKAVLRRRADPSLPGLVTLVAVLWFYLLPLTVRWFPRPESPLFVAFALAAPVLGILAVLGLARRRPRLIGPATTFLTITGTLLVARFASDVALTFLRSRGADIEGAVARDIRRPIAGPVPAPAPQRDVYLLVLDEYANADVLREVFGHDNRPFEDSLRALGFHVPKAVYSNYVHTTLSLPSLLNSAHLTRIAQVSPKARGGPTLANDLLERNRIAPYLQARGYRYVFYPSLWWTATHESEIADSIVRVWTGVHPARDLSRTVFRRAVWKGSALRFVERGYRWDADHLRRTLEEFGRLPEVDGPVFAFAHVLSPHYPYVLRDDCRTAFPPNEDRVAGYVEQLECLNAMLLGLVTELLRQSEVAPVILLQGDHGTSTKDIFDAPSAERIPADAARERLGAFGAYYLPDSGAAAFGDSVTVVNVLGNVLRHYFDAELPREPDYRYLSLIKSPYDFFSVERKPRASPRDAPGSTPTVVPAGRLRSSVGARAAPAGSAGPSRDAGGAGR